MRPMILADAMVRYADSRQSAGLQLRKAEVKSIEAGTDPVLVELSLYPGTLDPAGNPVSRIEATLMSEVAVSVSDMVYFLQQGGFALVIGKV